MFARDCLRLINEGVIKIAGGDLDFRDLLVMAQCTHSVMLPQSGH